MDHVYDWHSVGGVASLCQLISDLLQEGRHGEPSDTKTLKVQSTKLQGAERFHIRNRTCGFGWVLGPLGRAMTGSDAGLRGALFRGRSLGRCGTKCG